MPMVIPTARAGGKLSVLADHFAQLTASTHSMTMYNGCDHPR